MDGVVAVIDVDELTMRLGAGTTMEVFAVSTKLICVLSPALLPRNPVPVILMDVPPAAEPVVTLPRLVTVGTTG